MVRVKFIKNHKQHKKGEIESLDPNEAFGLINSGVAIVSKDMTESDYKTSKIMSTENTGVLIRPQYPSKTKRK